MCHSDKAVVRELLIVIVSEAGNVDCSRYRFGINTIEPSVSMVLLLLIGERGGAAPMPSVRGRKRQSGGGVRMLDFGQSTRR